MTFEDRLGLSTSEGIDIDLTIAGIGSRSLAWLLDGLILGAVLLIVGMGGVVISAFDEILASGISAMAALTLPVAYLVGMETLNGGRTLGKAAAGIKTVRISGAPVGLGAALIRTLILPFDVLVFGVGLMSMLATKNSQRLGDLAAGTVVVRERTKTRFASQGQELSAVPAGADRWDVSAITEEEIGAIRTYFDRATVLPPDRRRRFADELRTRIESRVGGVERRYEAEQFLARVLAEKTRPLDLG